MSHVYQKLSFSSPVTWFSCSQGNVGPSSVVGGHDINGEPIYVGRAVHAGDTIPGKVVSSHRSCYVSHAGHEHRHHHYQVLTNTANSKLMWVAAAGNLPHGAVQGGCQSDGTKLYIGRGRHQDSLIVGKVHPTHRCLYVPFDGREVSLSTYEVLVLHELNVY